jgi:hypothetical protein
MNPMKNAIAEYWRLAVDRAIEGVIHDYLMSTRGGGSGRKSQDVAATLGVPVRCVERVWKRISFECEQELERRKAVRGATE